MQCLGAHGCQYRCYTAHKYEWTIPKAPCGGGFSSELYTLKYLYQEWQYRYNIWTKTNEQKDLVRYTGCEFIFYRDPQTDFIVCYDIVPPFTLDKFTYMAYHPYQLLLRKNKKVIMSAARNPRGKLKVKVKIKPPKQMSTRWFFQQFFANEGLVNIICAAANLNYPLLGCCNENQIISLYWLNLTFFHSSTWAKYTTAPYLPLNTMKGTYTFTADLKTTQTKTIKIEHLTYDQSVDYQTGWFNNVVLNAKEVKQNDKTVANLPCGVGRYNMNLDHGTGNKVWLTPVNAGSYNVPSDEDLLFENYPLWLCLYGYISFLKQKKQDMSYFRAYMLVVKSPAIQPLQSSTHQEFFPLINRSFMLGNAPGDTYLDANMKKRWYPTLETQLETINDIVCTGPLIPRYDNQRNSNWQLNSKYTFYFKWGGALQTDHPVADPSHQPTWTGPDHLQQTVQISNPEHQKWETIFKPWDYRRGALTKTAIKRMLSNLSTDESVFSDADTHTPKKKTRKAPLLKIPEQENKEISTCLHSLFEESTSQETQEATEPNLLQLIHQQKQQQRELKNNLFTLIRDLKTHQKAIQYQTGLLN